MAVVFIMTDSGSSGRRVADCTQEEDAELIADLYRRRGWRVEVNPMFLPANLVSWEDRDTRWWEKRQ